ncbi:MAG: cardiolipin synthase [Bacillota bacterium]|nr:cardiolipin synthase [Bacillota bacterium]
MAYWFLDGVTLYLVITYVISFLISIAIIFLERKNPSATLAWLMVLFILPGIGILLYLFLSQNISRLKISHLNKKERRLIGAQLREQSEEIRRGDFPFVRPEAEKWKDLILMNQNLGGSFFTQDNKAVFFNDGKEKFDSLFRDLRMASESINIMYYIVRNDELGQELISLLTRKAREGVQVRFLLDALGSRGVFPRTLAEFADAGGKYAFFFPPKLKYLNMRLNYRNHRKLVIIDNEIGYIGGFNVGQEYLGKKKKFGYWRDTHMRATGHCVQDMNARFLLDWRFASGESVEVAQAYYDQQPVRSGSTGVQIISSGPDTGREESMHCYLKMINNAKERIFIQTPYFVPDPSILDALMNAVHSGVDVRIMIPCMPDHMFVYWATWHYAGTLLGAGARVYVYQNGFLHAKTLTVDGEVGAVGSTNFDIRSFRLNFEASAVLYDKEEVSRLDALFMADAELSTVTTFEEYQGRPLWMKFKESVCRLLSDLL